MRANQSLKSINYFPLFGVAGIALIFLYIALNAPQVTQSSARQAQLASGTEGLLKQTALHLSKMEGGASVGGFPGFEPPDDDERYKRKVEKSTASGEEVNTWVKEINNFLRQIANKNPGVTLEKILEKQGLTSEQITSFSNALKDVHLNASTRVGYGVQESTAKTLEELMRLLGVGTW